MIESSVFRNVLVIHFSPIMGIWSTQFMSELAKYTMEQCDVDLSPGLFLRSDTDITHICIESSNNKSS